MIRMGLTLSIFNLFKLWAGITPALFLGVRTDAVLARLDPYSRRAYARQLRRARAAQPSRAASELRRPAGPERAAARGARRAARREARARRGRYAEPDARPKRAWGGGRGGKKAHYHTGAFFPPSSFAGMIFEGARRALCQGREAAREAGEPLTQCPPCATSSSLAPQGRRRPDTARPKRGPIPPPGSLRARRAGAVAGV